MLRRTGIEARARLLGWLSMAVLRHALGALVDRVHPAARRAERLAARRLRSGERLALHLGQLKGAFAKAGQFASLRHDLVSQSLRNALARLQDRVPPLPFASVRACVETELGAPLEQRFTSFEALPLGAASLAQAHLARLPDGRAVVVKVQYPWLEASLASDLRVLRTVLRIGLWVAGRRAACIDLERVFSEFSTSLAEELDFENEARVAGQIARNLADDEQIVVPTVVTSHSTRRVLTMTHHECVGIGDRAGLATLGVSPRAVLEVLARAYARQIFADGLFHADPHPGNLFVLREPAAAERPRVLFVDFGLSRRLSPELRRQLRLGIYAVLQQDLDGLLARMHEMQMIAPGAEPGVRRAAAEMFERLAAASGAGGVLTSSGTQLLALKDEARRLLQATPGLQLPNDLLLYARTLSYLFTLGEQLDPAVDLMKISTPYLLRFLAGRD